MALSGLASAKPTNLVDYAYTQILENITNGYFGEGERIVIDTVAKDLDVSRIPVREALARLHAQKLLVYERNKGYTVLPKADFDVLLQARLIIEPSAVRYSPEKVTAEDIKALRDVNAKIAALEKNKTNAKIYMEFFDLNDQFHKKLVSLCENPIIEEAYANLSYGPQWARHAAQVDVPDLADNVAEHEAIIEALEQGNIELATNLVADHIVSGMDRFHQMDV